MILQLLQVKQHVVEYEQVLDTQVSAANTYMVFDGEVIEGDTGSALKLRNLVSILWMYFLSEDCEFSDEIVVEFKPKPEDYMPQDFNSLY